MIFLITKNEIQKVEGVTEGQTTAETDILRAVVRYS
jgi:hypothetical protein